MNSKKNEIRTCRACLIQHVTMVTLADGAIECERCASPAGRARAVERKALLAYNAADEGDDAQAIAAALVTYRAAVAARQSIEPNMGNRERYANIRPSRRFNGRGRG